MDEDEECARTKARGQGQTVTKIIPALSNPNCGGSGGGSICAGSSNIFLVQANNVTINQLAIDGDNPSLTSGNVIDGADIDARNGIITNHATGIYSNLNVNHVTMQNIFLRGIYASSGGSFNFSDNTVSNVKGNSGSIALFNFGCAGSFTNNTVSNANDGKATGFDAIFPNPNFAGTEFSYWGRQGIRLFGVELTNRLSLNPSLKSSKFQGQQNFVNPGLHLYNLGLDADLTPRLRSINNVNFLWFDQTSPLETYLFTGKVRNFIGTDISTGVEYRPLLNNNIVFQGGLATLITGAGFQDLFRNLQGRSNNPVAGFVDMVLEY